MGKYPDQPDSPQDYKALISSNYLSAWQLSVDNGSGSRSQELISTCWARIYLVLHILHRDGASGRQGKWLSAKATCKGHRSH